MRSNPPEGMGDLLSTLEASAPAAVPVLLPLPLDQPFDYALPERLAAAPGSFVRVPFAGREVVGVVWDRPGGKRVAAARLKPVLQALPVPPLPAALRGFLAEAAATTLTPLGTMLRLAVSVPSALDPPRVQTVYRAGPAAAPAKPSPVLTRVLAAFAGAPDLPASVLAKRARTSLLRLRQLAGLGHLLALERAVDVAPPRPRLDRPGVALTPGQAAAAAELRAMVRDGRGVALLDGVPGSGKTEVYLEAVAEALALGRRVLVLLPEIALSAQWLERFERRFEVAPIVWHSGLGSAARRRSWRWIAEGQVPVVVGARSALFLPLADLGLIVVDEEHDASFKQEEGAIYHARDLALRRARLERCAVILASATPSLETALAAGGLPGHAARRGWRLVGLPARFGPARPTTIELVDLRRDRPPRGGFLAPVLRQALRETVAAGGQALLFLNRRGYAPLALCRACGHRLRCPNCSAWLTAHRRTRRLLCHHCGYHEPEPPHCPHCGTVDAITLSGPGVERVAEEVRALLPEARLAIMTSDTVATAAGAERLVGAMAAHEVDVLVGTQMVAKGHHFPDLALVGVVDADLALGGGDLRAGERTFQLLYQVAGRAGRAALPGRALVQTHLPQHAVMQALASNQRDAFLAVELEERLAGGMPPFARLAALIVSGPDHTRVAEEARRLARSVPAEAGITLLGPAPAPLALLRGRWRERLLVRAAPEIDLPAWLTAWLALFKPASRVELTVDVDPQSFL